MTSTSSTNIYAVKRNANLSEILKRKQPLLSHLDIELTERCNNDCIHCYINLPEKDQSAINRELNTQQWKDILSQAAELGALTVRFTGGEPLLRSDFSEIYLFARKLGMKVYLFTNARLITSEMAQLFQRVPLLMKIEISVYGLTPKSYDSVARSLGAYEEAFRGIQNLLDYKIPFLVKSVTLPANKSERRQFNEWAATISDADVNSSSAVLLDLRARRDSAAKNKLITSLRLRPKEALQILTEDNATYKREMAVFCSRFIGLKGDLLFSCGAGDSGCVDAYGKYQVCMLLRHPDFVFDLKQGSLKEALTEAFPKFIAARAENPAYLERCAICFLKDLCEQCPAKSWTEYGNLDTPVEYLCKVAHAQAYFLGLLKGDEKAWDVDDWQDRAEQLKIEVHLQGGIDAPSD